MWDSFNGTLLPRSLGSSSQYINFGASPDMGFMGVGAGVPMGYPGSMGMMGMGGMFPGAFAGGMPYDTFNSSMAPNTPFLPQGELGRREGHGFGGFVSDALKLIGGIAVAVIAFKALKGKKVKA